MAAPSPANTEIWQNNRRIFTGFPSMFPMDNLEVTRRQKLHHLHRRVLGGNLTHVASFPTSNSKLVILELVTGAGDWCKEIARSNPAASVIGADFCDDLFDFDNLPENLIFLYGNLLYGGIGQPDATVDYLFARCVSYWCPEIRVPALMGELRRVLKPNGTIELCEIRFNSSATVLKSDLAPCTVGLMKWLAKLEAVHGINLNGGPVMAQALWRAGFKDIREMTVMKLLHRNRNDDYKPPIRSVPVPVPVPPPLHPTSPISTASILSSRTIAAASISSTMSEKSFAFIDLQSQILGAELWQVIRDGFLAMNAVAHGSNALGYTELSRLLAGVEREMDVTGLAVEIRHIIACRP